MTRTRAARSCAVASSVALSNPAAEPATNPRRVSIVLLRTQLCAHDGSPSRAPLHVGDSARHAELPAADFGQGGNAFADRFPRRIGEANAQAAIAMSFVGRPFRTRIDGNAASEGGLSELLGVDRVRQRDPEKNAALGLLELGRCAEMLGERVHQRLELAAQAAGEPRYVIGEMACAKLAQYHLLQGAGPGIGLEREHAREYLPICDDVADAQRRRDRFGKRADMDDAPAPAHGV